MVQIPSRAELIQKLVDAIRARDPAIETSFGPVKDIVIDPVSLVARDLYIQLKTVSDSLFLKNAETMSEEDLDNTGESWGIVRGGATSSTCSVFFRTPNKPALDIVIPSGIPVSTISTPADPNPVSFVTTKSVTFPAANAASFFDVASGNYEIEVPVKAVQPGISGRVAAGTIRTLQRQVPGFQLIINKAPAIGGRDIESNADYARRIRTVLLGTEKATSTGLARFALSDQRVTDAIVVEAGDSLMKRAESVSSAVDVYILGDDVATISQLQAPFDGSDFYFTNEPLVFPNPIIQITTTSPTGTLVEGTDYFLMRDPITSGSTQARNFIRWNRSSVNLPAVGTGSVTVQYSYDNLIRDLQASLLQPGNDILANVLFFRSTAVPIALTVTVKYQPGFNPSDIQTSIITVLEQYINTLGLGQSVIPSDLDSVIRTVPGVDFVVLPFTVLDVVGSSGSGIVSVAKNQYAQIAPVNMTITLST